MARVHFLNVGQGDCCIIEHVSGRATLVDISKGNLSASAQRSGALMESVWGSNRAAGDFGMSRKPTNPISYLHSLGITEIFRFILTHPDMDHLDGFDALADEFWVRNFWDSGVRRDKPSFDGSRYREEDWDRYVKFRDGTEPGVTVVHPRAGNAFKFANKDEANIAGGDGLSILAPTKELISAANDADVCNDASYVTLYRSAGGRILIPGDAHDETWDHVVSNYRSSVANVSVLFAPHHGRKSGCDFRFLETIRPKLTLFGCASSGDLAYEEWRSRGLPVITNNQAGNVVLEIHAGEIDVFVENEEFATALNVNTAVRNSQGYIYLGAVTDSSEVKVPVGVS